MLPIVRVRRENEISLEIRFLDPVYLLRQSKIKVRQSAAVVRGDLELGIAPAELYVRVMIGGLGQSADFIYKTQALCEVFELEPPRQFPICYRPSGDVLQSFVHLFPRQFFSFHWFFAPVISVIICVLNILHLFAKGI